jgi:hypothetical protein
VVVVVGAEVVSAGCVVVVSRIVVVGGASVVVVVANTKVTDCDPQQVPFWVTVAEKPTFGAGLEQIVNDDSSVQYPIPILPGLSVTAWPVTQSSYTIMSLSEACMSVYTYEIHGHSVVVATVVVVVVGATVVVVV